MFHVRRSFFIKTWFLTIKSIFVNQLLDSNWTKSMVKFFRIKFCLNLHVRPLLDHKVDSGQFFRYQALFQGLNFVTLSGFLRAGFCFSLIVKLSVQWRKSPSTSSLGIRSFSQVFSASLLSTKGFTFFPWKKGNFSSLTATQRGQHPLNGFLAKSWEEWFMEIIDTILDSRQVSDFGNFK